MVNALMDSLTFRWDEHKISSLFPRAQGMAILQTPKGLIKENDRLIWPHQPSRKFSVKSGYQIAKQQASSVSVVVGPSHAIPDELWASIWSSLVPPKIRNFVWRACHNALAVKNNLHRRRISPSNLCPVCQTEPETIEHALLLRP